MSKSSALGSRESVILCDPPPLMVESVGALFAKWNKYRFFFVFVMSLPTFVLIVAVHSKNVSDLFVCAAAPTHPPGHRQPSLSFVGNGYWLNVQHSLYTKRLSH